MSGLCVWGGAVWEELSVSQVERKMEAGSQVWLPHPSLPLHALLLNSRCSGGRESNNARFFSPPSFKRDCQEIVFFNHAWENFLSRGVSCNPLVSGYLEILREAITILPSLTVGKGEEALPVPSWAALLCTGTLLILLSQYANKA